ncbi:hypothetical protein LX36DRAFT_287337 [Colletotrichum falcatum]|nr:hypothetical protein LX36DRAFT_287337 [Colletotrichum falcatum]
MHNLDKLDIHIRTWLCIRRETRMNVLICLLTLYVPGFLPSTSRCPVWQESLTSTDPRAPSHASLAFCCLCCRDGKEQRREGKLRAVIASLNQSINRCGCDRLSVAVAVMWLWHSSSRSNNLHASLSTSVNLSLSPSAATPLLVSHRHPSSRPPPPPHTTHHAWTSSRWLGSGSGEERHVRHSTVQLTIHA